MNRAAVYSDIVMSYGEEPAMQVILDAEKMKTRREAHEYLKQELDFPDYYGGNLDALYDCLTEKDDLEIFIQNIPAEEEQGYFHAVCHVLEEAARETPGIQVRLLTT